jgi:hypothetical protein
MISGTSHVSFLLCYNQTNLPFLALLLFADKTGNQKNIEQGTFIGLLNTC